MSSSFLIHYYFYPGDRLSVGENLRDLYGHEVLLIDFYAHGGSPALPSHHGPLKPDHLLRQVRQVLVLNSTTSRAKQYVSSCPSIEHISLDRPQSCTNSTWRSLGACDETETER